MAHSNPSSFKSPDLSKRALWKQRFRANKIRYARLAQANSQQGLVCCQADGVLQLHAWNVASGQLRQVTHSPIGVWNGAIAASGDYIYFLKDNQGNETGHYHRVPFTGGDPEDITPDLPPYGSFSLNENPTGKIMGLVLSSDATFQGYVLERDENGQLGTPRKIWQSQRRSYGPRFSYDGEVAVFATTERSGTNATSLVAVKVATAEVVAELWLPDVDISPVRFEPQPGALRFLATTDESGFVRPLIWNLADGTCHTLELSDLKGDIGTWDWSASDKLLLCQYYQAQQQLYQYDVVTRAIEAIAHPAGSIGGGYFDPDNRVIVTFSNSTSAGSLFALSLQPETAPIEELLTVDDAPPCQPWRSVTFASRDGTDIQAWLAAPSAPGPYPTILHVHGGPSSAVTETYSPSAQAWLDHGYAWLSVNYRGSTTFGKDFERAIWGQLGQLEVDDMVAAHAWLIENKIAHPQQIFVTGGSYGGYLTLQALGMTPDLWAGGMADVAIADWFLMYEDQSPMMQAVQRNFFQGTPDEKPEAHRLASPSTYAEQVKAPILVIQGRNDTRCPARQMEVYEDRLQALGKSIQVHWFNSGHVAGDMEQAIAHQALKLQFAAQVLSNGGR